MAPDAPRCSFCHEDRAGGVAGTTPDVYICPDCIRRHHRLIRERPAGRDDPERGRAPTD